MKAFPSQGLSNMSGGQLYEAVYNNGMDLRDYFAGQALSGLLAHPDTKPDSWIASKAAYQIADNMMKAREQ